MNRNNQRTVSRNRLNKPYIIGYMSVDVSREYHHDLSELKYVTSIAKGKLNYDLNHNIENAVKRTTDEKPEKLTLLLRFLLDQRHRLKFINGVSNCTTFISYRSTLISVLSNAFNPERQFIVASLFNNCIYLCSVQTPEKAQRINSLSDQEKRFYAWGYKFEQYMCADLPNLQPDIEKPVIENAEFSMCYVTELGKHRLFYVAQIDGLLATGGVAPKPETEDVENNLNYLRSNDFVELKTNREIQHWRQESNFKRYKMLYSWAQCYLAGLKGTVVGYRNDEGIVQRLQWFDTEDIVEYCKDHWDPQTTLNYLSFFLNYVENSFKSLKKTSADESEPKRPVTLFFEIDKSKNITVNENVNEEHLILPDWYINAF